MIDPENDILESWDKKYMNRIFECFGTKNKLTGKESGVNRLIIPLGNPEYMIMEGTQINEDKPYGLMRAVMKGRDQDPP